MPAATTCPSKEVLEHFDLGQLSALEIEEWAAHVEQCAQCTTILQGFHAQDTVVEAIKNPGSAPAQRQHPLVQALIAGLHQRRPEESHSTLDDGLAKGDTAETDYRTLLAPAQQPDELGRLGPYRVLKVLGTGGMGVVFLGHDPHLDRPVALKAMLPRIAADPTAKERFFREARAAANLHSDHIVQIHQVGEDRGIPFLAMEFLEGHSLKKLIEMGRTLPLPQILRIGREVALGLAAAHAKGLIHRDIKPANIWLEARTSEPEGVSPRTDDATENESRVRGLTPAGSPSTRVKILDFGLARTDSDDVQLTQSGAVLGTPAFMAPEQARGDKGLDHRVDLFSLGCVLYRLCAGELPFKGATTMNVLMALASHEPTPPCQINSAIPQGLSDLVMQLIAKNPEQRPAAAHKVAQRLAEMERQLADSTTTTVQPAPAAPGRSDCQSDRTDWQSESAATPVTPVSREASAPGRAVSPEPAPSPESSGASPPPGRPNLMWWPLVAAALLLLIGGGFAAYQLLFRTIDGTLIVEVDGDADVRFQKGELRIYDTDGKLKYTLKPSEKNKALPPGKYLVEVAGVDGLKLNTDKFEIADNHRKATVRVTVDAAERQAKQGSPAVRYALECPSAGRYVTVPSLELDWRGPRTIEGYITPQGKQDGGSSSLVAWNRDPKGVPLIFYIHGANQNLWSFSFHADDNKGRLVPSSWPMVAGKKTHVALVFTGRQFRLFLDGTVAVTKDVSDLSFDNKKGEFAIGHMFTGLITEVRVSTVARYEKNFTPAERFEPDADTLALYHFDEGSGDVLKDSSGNGHHGKITNARWVKDDEAWLKQVAALPPDKQVEAVAAKLKERNPDFDGNVEPKIKDGVVIELTFMTDNVTDLSPVRALAGLQTFRCFGSPQGKRRLADLTLLRGMKLTTLICPYTQVAELTPLQGMPLTRLECGGTPVADLAPLKGMPLAILSCVGTQVADLSPLRGMPLTSLDCNGTRVADLSPLKGMPLAILSCVGTQVADLSPLRGMPLTSLDCNGTRVADLSPLKDMKLILLQCSRTQVADLSLLKGMPLKTLSCDFKAERDAAILRSIKTLETINGKPAAEFWKAVDGK